MKKTSLMKAMKYEVFMWGYDDKATGAPCYTIYIALSFESTTPKEQLSALKKYLSTLRFKGVDKNMLQTLGKFATLGVKGQFNLVKYSERVWGLKAKRFVPKFVREQYRQQQTSAAADKKASAIDVALANIMKGVK